MYVPTAALGWSLFTTSGVPDPSHCRCQRNGSCLARGPGEKEGQHQSRGYSPAGPLGEREGHVSCFVQNTLDTPGTDFLFAGLLTSAVSNRDRIVALGELDVFIGVFIRAQGGGASVVLG